MSKKLSNLIKAETKRQQETLGLIPSENIASPAVLAALGSPLTNKYSEGYPGKRYYQGNQIVDEIELYAQEQGLKAFGLRGALSSVLPMSESKVSELKGLGNSWFLNVQAHSGSPANAAIYFALAEPGDTVMGQSLAHGGHLTHGANLNFSSRFYNAVQYGLDPKKDLIDYDQVESLAKRHKPRIIYSGTTAYPQIIDFKRFGKIAKSVGAYHVADVSHIAGLIAGGAHQAPFPYADVVMATTHKTMRGPRGAVIFSKGPELAYKINKAIIPGLQGGPHNNVTAAIAVMFEEMQKVAFKRYAKQVVKNAAVLAAELKRYGFALVSGGTKTHLILIDLKSKNITGKAAALLLEEAGIVANKNSVPGDEKPFNPSGLRIGTPLLTSRGMKEKEMKEVAMFMHHLVDLKEPAEFVRKEVVKLCKKFPLPYK
ncbi:MAG: serine hydroxymethyltransferase [Candidatus Harrisonbacteria bacterium CG10_big_fil_rev_8_21_14_0_10_49_15]|uniref:Serine hydroxymethyltransferase n=1 Tax=Candidatus Harrisonbacteria bacterium CG10_big_fil_rev_8_21_14_0_10_49_15 TaxID=1974587 RepID=A0A2H0UL11_9BACT|nr:MAG: serine hydroxymethyltransferase [Candidatus Harrisonbacteria bacterium CG10_big_fil_rev_8_21_14_0_10_49_15]